LLKECNYDIREYSRRANEEAPEFLKAQAAFKAEKRRKARSKKSA